MNSRNFFAELKRRNVYKVAVAYAVVGWLLVQVTTQVFPIFRNSELGFQADRARDRHRFSYRACDRVGVRTDPGRIEAHGRCRSRRARTHQEIRLDFCRDRWSARFQSVCSLSGATRPEIRLRRPEATAASSVQKSIAVLPFDNLSGDKQTLISPKASRRKSSRDWPRLRT